MRIRLLLLCLCFFVFFYPVSISDGTSGVTANYTFILLPMLSILLAGKVKKVPPSFVLSMAFYTFIFFASSLTRIDQEPFRRFASFGVFMTIFAFSFIEIDPEMVRAFKVSITGISLYFCLTQLYNFFTLGGPALGFAAKDLVGGNRLGFIYLMAIWVVYFYRAKKRSHALIKYLILSVLLAGLLLTFSRSSLVGLLGSLTLYTIFKAMKWFSRPNLAQVFRGAIPSVLIIILLFVFLQNTLPTAFEFFGKRLVANVLDRDLLETELVTQDDTLGIRVFIAQHVLNYLIQNPLTGSGFLGVWIFPDLTTVARSAHSQYLDVLFRTGFLGFALYMYLVLRILVTLYAEERSLFWGSIGVLMFGVFNETFKESQGTFLLAFFLGMAAQSWRYKHLTMRSVRAAQSAPTKLVASHA